MTGRAMPVAHSRAPALALGLTALLLVLLSGLSGLLGWQSYRQAIEAAEAEARNASQVVAAHMQWLVEASYQALRRIDTALVQADALTIGTTGDLDDAVAGLPANVYAWVFDAEGRSVQNNADALAAVSIADEDDFTALKAGDEWQIGRLRNGLVSDQQVFLISRRLERDGRFIGVASLTIPVALLSDFWQSLDLGPSSSVGLVRLDGWLVARYPAPNATMNLGQSPLLQVHFPKARSGSYSSDRSPTDGIARIVGYTLIHNLPLIVTAGVSKTAVIDRLRSQIGTAALFVVPIALALIAAAVWIYRLLRRDRQTNDALERALEENRMLFREIHHRVKNNLQTVASLVQLQPGSAEDKQAMIRRLTAMTAVHEQIYGSDQFARLDLAAYVEGLLEKLKESHRPGIDVVTRLEPMEVDTEVALPFGLVLNEVVSNAFKHAFPEARSGTIVVTLQAVSGERARLLVEDDGVGYEPPAGGGERPRAGPGAGGMGSRLIRGLTQQLDGSYRFPQGEGTSFELIFPRSRTKG